MPKPTPGSRPTAPGARIWSLAINENGDIFAGNASGGVFRSTDNGNDWSAINSGLPNHTTVEAFAITSGGDIFMAAHSGLFRSSNNGDNWTSLDQRAFDAVAINASGEIFAIFSGVVIHSTDNGDSWTETGTIPTSTVLVLAVNSSGDLFAGTNGDGVFRSTDNGDTWAQINTGLTNTGVNSFAVNGNGHLGRSAIGECAAKQPKVKYVRPAEAFSMEKTQNHGRKQSCYLKKFNWPIIHFVNL